MNIERPSLIFRQPRLRFDHFIRRPEAQLPTKSLVTCDPTNQVDPGRLGFTNDGTSEL